MTISVFDLFSVGIGPSSSHTVGPMRAAARFVDDLHTIGAFGGAAGVAAVRVDLFGSLAATGAGHGTMTAILLGLEGNRPEEIRTDVMERRVEEMRASGHVMLGGLRAIPLTESDMVLRPLTVLPFHPNGMTLTAFDSHGAELHRQTYFSIGGGFVVTEAESLEPSARTVTTRALSFDSAKEMMELCRQRDCSISDLMLAVECETRTADEVRARLLHIRDVMVECEVRGIARDGYLPGPMRVRRRARDWFERLNAEDWNKQPEFAEDWVNLVALAVNEENASGGRVVTAPTNGAAGIVPAVLPAKLWLVWISGVAEIAGGLGLRLGLGTDTAPPDLVAGMQMGITLCRVMEGGPEACRAEDYFDAATLGGAEALGRPDLGRIEVGARADLVAFELGLPHQYQVIDPIQTLLLTGRGRDARTVIVDGRFAMEDRIIPGIDEAAFTARAQAQFDRLVALYPDRTWNHPPTHAIFRSSYPIGTDRP